MTLFRKSLFVLVLLIVAAGITRAALEGFQAKQEAVLAECRAERKRLGLTDEVLRTKYPTPEISLITPACVPVGGTGELVVKGKFAPGSKFLLQSDHIVIVKESLTATEYRATIKAQAGIGPEVADIQVFSPVSCISAQAQKAAVVTGKFEFDLQASNGWRIKARPVSDTRCNPRGRSEFSYNVEFFRGTETVAFQKREGELTYSPYSQNPFYLRVQEEQFGGDLNARMMALTKKMMDTSLSEAEREKAMTEIGAIQEKMVAQFQDKAVMQKEAQQLEQRKKEFGCTNLDLRLNGSQVQGVMRCGELVGRSIQVNGTMKVGPTS